MTESGGDSSLRQLRPDGARAPPRQVSLTATDEGSSRESFPVLTPSSVPSGQLPPKGKPYVLIIPPQGKSRRSAAVLNLRIPARVAARRILRAFGIAERRAFYACRSSFAKIFSNENILARLRFICTSARRILRAFGTVDRRAFYACRSFFAKIFSRENILAISYNVVAKGVTALCLLRPTFAHTCASAEKGADGSYNCCEIPSAEKTERRAKGERWVFSFLTEILFVSSKRIS